MYDAMPAVWENMFVESCKEVIEIVDEINKKVGILVNMWDKELIQRLLIYVPLSEMIKMHACIIAAKSKPCVIDTPPVYRKR